MSVRYETKNPLPAAARHRMIEELNLVMADILDNHYQSLLAHWNTRGANFTELHKLFEEYAGSNGAENWCDWVAERIGQLGGTVETTIPFIAAKTSLPEYPLAITTGEEHARAGGCGRHGHQSRARRDGASTGAGGRGDCRHPRTSPAQRGEVLVVL